MRDSYLTGESTTSEQYFLNVPDGNGSTAKIPLGHREYTTTSHLDDLADTLTLTDSQLEGALDTHVDKYVQRQLASRRYVVLRRSVTAATLAASGVSAYEAISHDSVGFLIAGAALGVSGVASHIRGERSIASEKNVRRFEAIQHRKQVTALTGLMTQFKSQKLS